MLKASGKSGFKEQQILILLNKGWSSEGMDHVKNTGLKFRNSGLVFPQTMFSVTFSTKVQALRPSGSAGTWHSPAGVSEGAAGAERVMLTLVVA